MTSATSPITQTLLEKMRGDFPLFSSLPKEIKTVYRKFRRGEAKLHQLVEEYAQLGHTIKGMDYLRYFEPELCKLIPR